MQIPNDQVAMIRTKGLDWLASKGLDEAALASVADRYTVLHRSGAYMALEPKTAGGYPVYSDGHIETALCKAWPSAPKSKERKRY